MDVSCCCHYVILLCHVTLLLGVTSSPANGSEHESEEIIVHTANGQLRGLQVTLNYDLGRAVKTSVVRQFLGVPYALPPVGDRRFALPQPMGVWSGVKDALEFGSVCPQVSNFHPLSTTPYQSEDCLFLNIYSPVIVDSANQLLPVIIYIHGGSFEVGAGSLYDGRVLALFGVVVVTINYRLGALGFLLSGTPELPGNYGLYDMIAALNWVKVNIAHFGGDPDRVTLVGHSAGGAAVGLLSVIPQAKNLFHTVIALSGSALATYACHEPRSVNFPEYINKVGALFHCEGSVRDIVQCLRSVPAEDIVDKRFNFPLSDPLDTEFRPSVDGKLLMDMPRNLFNASRYHDNVTFVMGTVDNEFGNYFSDGPYYRPEYEDALDRYVRKLVGTDIFDDVIRREYTRHDHVLRTNDLISDVDMIVPTVCLAALISRNPTTRVYEYHYTMDNSYHSVDLNYVFGAPFTGWYADDVNTNIANPSERTTFTAGDRALSVKVMRMLTHIAITGQPETAVGDGVTWLQFKPQSRAYLQLSQVGEAVIRHHLFARSVYFWTCVLPETQAYRGLPQNGFSLVEHTPCHYVAASARLTGSGAWLVTVGVAAIMASNWITSLIA